MRPFFEPPPIKPGDHLIITQRLSILHTTQTQARHETTKKKLTFKLHNAHEVRPLCYKKVERGNDPVAFSVLQHE